MAEGRKPPRTPGEGVVYDLAARRRERAALPDRADPMGDAGSVKEAGQPKPVLDGSPAELRARRIAELKAKIARGEYNPDPAEIANELLKRGF